MSVQWLGYMLKDLDWSKRNISSPNHPDQFQCPPSLQLNENHSFFSGSKVSWADSLSTHIHLEASLKINGAIPPLNLSAPMSHMCTILFYLNLLPKYIFLKRSHSFWSYKGDILYITYLLHAHSKTHLFHLHWFININIMMSSNNKPHYIIFCFLLLLTPSIGHIFSW